MRSQNTGTPSSTSRVVPPPKAASAAINTNPTGSICLREAVSAPAAASTATPASDSAAMAASAPSTLRRSLPHHRPYSAGCTFAARDACAPPAHSSDSASTPATTGSTSTG